MARRPITGQKLTQLFCILTRFDRQVIHFIIESLEAVHDNEPILAQLAGPLPEIALRAEITPTLGRSFAESNVRGV
jgi:hypothetical protein